MHSVSKDWRFFFFDDGSAVSYHPFEGVVHACAGLHCTILRLLHDQPLTLAELVAVCADWHEIPEADLVEFAQSMSLAIDALRSLNILAKHPI